jgi:hypothetical protein
LELADHRGLRQQPGMAHEHHRGSQSDSYNHALTIGRNEPRLKETALEMVSQAWMSYQEGLLESFFSDQVPDNQSNRSTPSVNWVCYFIFSRRPANGVPGGFCIPVPIENVALFDAVQDVRAAFQAEVARSGADTCRSAFLSRFPFAILDSTGTATLQAQRERLINAAFAPAFRPAVERTIEICSTDWGGGNTERFFVHVIEDFLNCALPRTPGLPGRRRTIRKLLS